MIDTDQWGFVSGDMDAKTIALDLKDQRTAHRWATRAIFIAMIACVIWYVVTGERLALAAEIVTATWYVAALVQIGMLGTHTFVMIAERRIQLVEQRLTRMDYEATLAKA